MKIVTLRYHFKVTAVLFSFLVASATLIAAHKASTYYVSPSGNDANTGLSQKTAWKSISRLYKDTFMAGDSILFEGGKTFAGNIYLSPLESGTARNPLVFSSYGTGRAIINAGTSYGFFAYNTAGIVLSRLIFTGSGLSTNKDQGVFFYMNLPKDTMLRSIVIDSVNVYGFIKDGIDFYTYPTDSSRSGYRDVRITNCKSYNNGNNGIMIWGYYNTTDTLYSQKHIYIGNCTTNGNGGSGIEISQVDSALIERCESFNNGLTGGGVVGIWTWDSKRVVIQYCESHDNKSQGSDGDGFDLDGGTSYCIMQYNYSHNNIGAGFLLWQYDRARPFHNNIVRYNISENDSRGQKGYYGVVAIGMGKDTMINTGVHNVTIYNNTFYKTRISGNDSGQGAAISSTGLRITNIKVYNNIFVLDSTSRFINLYQPAGITFLNNDYWGNSGFWVTDGYKNYHSLRGWEDSTLQEIYNGRRLGLKVDPMLSKPGKGGLIGKPSQLAFLSAYKLMSGSSIISKSLNMDSLLTFPNVFYDFYGDTLEPYHTYTPGAHEPQVLRPGARAMFHIKNICIGDSSMFLDSSVGAVSYNWSFGDGGTSTYKSPGHRYKYTGVYKVTLVVTSSFGKKDSLTKILSVYSLPDSDWTQTDTGLSCHFTAANSSLSFYQWNFGDTSALAHSFKTQHRYKYAGTYYVNLFVKDSNGCQAGKRDTVSVRPLFTGIEAYTADFNLSVNPDPFTERTVMNYEIKANEKVAVKLFDYYGKQIAVLQNSTMSGGPQSLQISASDYNLKAGVYYLQIIAGSHSAVSRIIKVQ